jgi:hypothetical protein
VFFINVLHIEQLNQGLFVLPCFKEIKPRFINNQGLVFSYCEPFTGGLKLKYIYGMKSKILSYKVEGILLEPFNDNLKLSKDFDRKELLNQVKEILKEQNFKLDEHSLDYKISDNQLYIEGIATEHQESKSIGFMTGK